MMMMILLNANTRLHRNAVVMLFTRDKSHRFSWWLQSDLSSENRKRKGDRINEIIHFDVLVNNEKVGTKKINMLNIL